MAILKHYLNRFFEQFKDTEYPYYFDGSKNPYFYYIDFSNKISKNLLFDSNGIPLTPCPLKEEKDNIKWQYNPTKIALYTLLKIDDYLKDRGNVKILETLKILSEWFLSNYIEKNGTYFWGTFCDYKRYNTKNPYPSSMAQGLVLSIMSRFKKLLLPTNFKDEEIVKKILNSFLLESKNGGIKTSLKGETFYEETPSNPSSLILNGFLFSLFGLYDISLAFNSDLAKQLFKEGVESLKKNINLYDSGCWSLYDLLYKEPATYDYHKLHISQLKVLAQMTGDEVFENFAIKWNNYSKNFLYKSYAIFKKAFLRVVRYGRKK